ncbi:hypothetical protein MPSEU_000378000 [Mayamaea pseudoterrestris]|nr:hypothetical protein MPSEU_000378000 [Mayamaea pseudoterrestris]
MAVACRRSISYWILMATLTWRTSMSRALLASFAASASSYRRVASNLDSNSSGLYPSYHRQSRLLLGFQDRSFSSDQDRFSSRPADEKENSARDEDTASPIWSKATRSVRELRSGLSRIFSAAGFLSSSTTSLFTDRNQLQRLKVTVDAFQNFLTSSGIDMELSESLNIRLLDNLIILGRVQKAAFLGIDIRDTVALDTVPANLPSSEEWYKYMRFATAAYGAAMIRAAEIDVKGKFDARFLNRTVIKKRMSEHVGIPENDLVVLDVDFDGNTKHLRYFVAVDHADKKIVLAIRGTFSLSEIVTDVAAFSRPFCGGEAHSEMATVAERTWEVVGPTILKLLESNPTYELVLTGHSLGAGCAALLNIMCHQDDNKLVNGRPVRCFAYACPPVFAPLESASVAIKACTGFINEEDVVPLLSVDSVRHVFASIRAIEELNIPWRERMKLVTGLADLDERLTDAVGNANQKRLTPLDGAPVLCVPAQASVWLREKKLSGKFDAKICDPVKISRTPIQIGVDMLQDHFVSRYEVVLYHLEETEQTAVTEYTQK